MSLLSNETFRKFFSGRRRFKNSWVFEFLLIFNAQHYPSILGTVICLLGASLRFASSGFLRKEAKLAVGGPYSHTRNPLYLGTFIMAVGATISVGAWILAAAMGFVFFLNYHYVIEHEEKKLPSYFGDAYRIYCELVPRFLPRITKPSRAELLKVNSDPEVYRFDLKLAHKNKALEAYISFVALILGMALLVLLKKHFGLIAN